MPNSIVELPNGGEVAFAVRRELTRALFYRLGLPESVIAKALGVSRKTVRNEVDKPYDPKALAAIFDAVSREDAA